MVVSKLTGISRSDGTKDHFPHFETLVLCCLMYKSPKIMYSSMQTLKRNTDITIVILFVRHFVGKLR